MLVGHVDNNDIWSMFCSVSNFQREQKQPISIQTLSLAFLLGMLGQLFSAHFFFLRKRILIWPYTIIGLGSGPNRN